MPESPNTVELIYIRSVEKADLNGYEDRRCDLPLSCPQSMAGQFRDLLTFRFRIAFAEIENDRGALIPQILRSFLTEVAVESLTLHQSAWKEHDLNPMDCGHWMAIVGVAEASLRSLLENAEAEAQLPDSPKFLTLIGVLKQLNDRWCKIFPFCR